MLTLHVDVQVINHVPIHHAVINHALHQDAVVHHINHVLILLVAKHIIVIVKIVVEVIKPYQVHQVIQVAHQDILATKHQPKTRHAKLLRVDVHIIKPAKTQLVVMHRVKVHLADVLIINRVEQVAVE